MWQLRGGELGRIKVAQVDGMNVVVWGVEICLGEGDWAWNHIREDRRLGDCGNLFCGDGGKVEFMVKQGFLGKQRRLEYLGRETKEAGVRPCAEGDYLFSLRGEGREKADDEIVNGASADVCSWLNCWPSL